jgi:hypothetical protein
LRELGAEQAEVAFDALGAANHDVIRSGEAFRRQDLAGERAKAALHPITNDCASDLLGDREAGAHRGVRILTVADEQNETGSGRAPAGVGGDEIGALLDRF